MMPLLRSAACPPLTTMKNQVAARLTRDGVPELARETFFGRGHRQRRAVLRSCVELQESVRQRRYHWSEYVEDSLPSTMRFVASAPWRYALVVASPTVEQVG